MTTRPNAPALREARAFAEYLARYEGAEDAATQKAYAEAAARDPRLRLYASFLWCRAAQAAATLDDLRRGFLTLSAPLRG